MGKNNYFQFKEFKIVQEKSAMKVGTDGILLGAWVNKLNHKNILDIGTGTGLISLMLAQRTKARILALEIDANAANEAKYNVANSPWKDKIETKNISFQNFVNFSNQKFDLIVSNPPFFENSIKKKEKAQTTARHTDSLTFKELVNGVSSLLSKSGRFAVILPTLSKTEFIKLANNVGLFLTRTTLVFPKSGVQANRCLMEFSKIKKAHKEEELTIYDLDGNYTSDYKTLTKDFYLNF